MSSLMRSLSEGAEVANATLSDCLELPDLPTLKKHIYPNKVEAYKRGLLFEFDTLRASGYGLPWQQYVRVAVLMVDQLRSVAVLGQEVKPQASFKTVRNVASSFNQV
jgi:hypothetical protein